MLDHVDLELIAVYKQLHKKNPSKAKEVFKRIPFWIYDSEADYYKLGDAFINNWCEILNLIGKFTQSNENENIGYLHVPSIRRLRELLFKCRNWPQKENIHFISLVQKAYRELRFANYEGNFEVTAYIPDCVEFKHDNKLPGRYDQVVFELFEYIEPFSFSTSISLIMSFQKYLAAAIRYGNLKDKKYSHNSKNA